MEQRSLHIVGTVLRLSLIHIFREQMEQRELEYLSPYAAMSVNSKGRDREEIPCDIRPVYQRDRDRILHCKAFRRLKQKTQVFLMPKGDHYRTRLTHTLEVSQNEMCIRDRLCGGRYQRRKRRDD